MPVGLERAAVHAVACCQLAVPAVDYEEMGKKNLGLLVDFAGSCCCSMR